MNALNQSHDDFLVGELHSTCGMPGFLSKDIANVKLFAHLFLQRFRASMTTIGKYDRSTEDLHTEVSSRIKYEKQRTLIFTAHVWGPCSHPVTALAQFTQKIQDVGR